MSKQQDDFFVVAVVKFNKGEALVLNRPIRFLYEKSGKDFIGVDGPFRDLLAYEKGGGRFVAFAGRELSIPMKDGSIQKLKDHWWSSHIKGDTSVVVGCVSSLRKCYVFRGAAASPDVVRELRSKYTGPVYEYYEYEKILKSGGMIEAMTKAALDSVASCIDAAVSRHLVQMALTRGYA